MTISLALATDGLETWALVDVDGVEHGLSDLASYRVIAGARGRPMPPVSVETDQVPFRAGSRFRRASVDERIVTVPLLVSGDTYLQARDRVAQLAAWLDPARGDVRLRVTRPDGARRELVCRYRGGLDDSDLMLAHRSLLALEFLAADPFWQDLADTTTVYTVPPAQAGFFPMTLPLQLPSGDIFVNAVVNNSGYDRQDAWPIWTIVGPGVQPALRNETTGRYIIVLRTLAAGETLIIDTRPGIKTVTVGGAPVAPTVDSNLWPLIRGFNLIRLDMGGAVVGTSSLTLAYRVRYLGP